MKGYRAIIFNLVAAAAAYLEMKYDIILDQGVQEAITIAVFAIGNILIRIYLTKTPVFNRDKERDNGGHKVPKAKVDKVGKADSKVQKRI